MTLTPLPSFETAESAISKIIAPAEGYGHSGNVYPDPVSGLDIGYGIQLIGPNGTGGALTPNNGNVAIVLSAMGVPQQYMADAMAAVLGVLTKASSATVISEAAAANIGGALNGAIQRFLLPGQQFNLTEPNAFTALQSVVQNITMPKLNTLLNLNGLSYLTTSAGNDSQEYAALADLYYAGAQKTIGTNVPTPHISNILSALSIGNRADAWFQIRYKSNGNQQPGIAKRRYYDAQIFGLFSNPSKPSDTEVLQAYQMLTANRQTIIAYEATYGVDPDSAAPAVNGNRIAQANDNFHLSGTNSQVLTLNEAFCNAEPTLLSMLANVTQSPFLKNLSSNWVLDTNIFLASSTDPNVNAGMADPVVSSRGPLLSSALTQDDLAEASANHLVIGTGGGQQLTGGLGNDVVVAGSGNETLNSGWGEDTIVAGAGTDVINLRAGSVDSIDFEFGAQNGVTEIINSNSDRYGAVYIAGTEITGSAVTPVKSDNGNTLQWNDSGVSGYTYTFTRSLPGSSTGSLTIAGGPLAASADTIVINDFSLSSAEKGGSLGIVLQGSAELNTGSNAGVDPPPPAFTAGTSQTYTFATDTASTDTQTVTVALSGVPASDFAITVDNQVVTENSDGTFSFTLPAGQTSVSFLLTNTADVDGNANLQVSATLADPSFANATLIMSNTLAQSFVEPTDDPFNTPTAALYDFGQYTAYGPTVTGGLQFEDYSNDPVFSPVTQVSSGNNYIEVGLFPNSTDSGELGTSNDSVDGGSGNDTVVADFGDNGTDGGVNVINGHGGQDFILTGYATDSADGFVPTSGPSAVRIYANSEVDLATAIADANSESATNQHGDFIHVFNSASTIVGGSGNDLLADGDGTSGVIVAGSGNDTILGGVDLVLNSDNSNDKLDVGLFGDVWSATFANNQLYLGGDLYFLASGVSEAYGSFTAPPAGYEGNVDGDGEALDSGNDTIFGGSGNDVVVLSNGDNLVQLGVGDSTALGGMGENTILGGGGDNSIVGGGGSDYIEDGSGNSVLIGRGGNNTLIGGSGDDTLVAGNTGSDWASSETGNNYVDGGTGNALLYGAGGSDTLIAGDGNSTVYGGVGNEDITGGAGNDELIGGNGNDTIDAGGAGADLIQAGTGFSTIYGGDGSDTIQGTSGTDLIYAGDGGTPSAPTEVIAGTGSTTVYGGDGTDEIVGGTGTDVLYAGDGGTDSNPTLVEAGTGPTTIYGGAGADNLLDSVGGSDLIVAGSGDANLVGSGNDTLMAGSGNDYLSGTGNLTDVFSSTSGDAYVDTTSSNVTLEFTPDVAPTDLTIGAELGSDGSLDLVIQGDGGTITVAGGLDPGVVQGIVFEDPETLTLTGMIQQADAAGDTDPATIAGPTGNLIFDTSEGDSVTAGTGADTISAWGDDDTLTAGSAGTLILAAGDGNVVYGGSGGDTLEASGANTTLYGGTANTLFEVNDPTDVVIGSGVTNDTILSSVNYTLPTAVDTLTLTGTADLTAAGNADAQNLITGNSGNDFLIAGPGADTLVSGSGVDALEDGSGGDTFVVNNSADVVYAQDYGYQDTIESSVSYVLQAPVYTLNLTGSSDLTATDAFGYATITGNAGNDTLIGGSGYDELVAGSGIDTLVAGTGNTTFVVNNEADVIDASGGAGHDTVDSSANFTLSTGVDHLTLTGSADLVGTGNADTYNVITGNAGNDRLIAGSGSDALYAGTGVDTLVAGTGADTLYGHAGDTYDLGNTFQNVQIDQSSGSGTVLFGAGIAPSDLTAGLVVGLDGNPALVLQDGNNSVTIADGLGSSIGKYEFADGSELSLQQLLSQAQGGSTTLATNTGNLVLDGAADAVLTGGFGNDTIIGTGANDTIHAGGGNQDLYGENTGDVLVGNVGNDTLNGGSGDDTLIAGTGDTVMKGGQADDFYELTEGGTATIVPSSTSGAEVIVLPQGMTISDFTSYQGTNGELILQSLSGDTAAMIDGFDGPTSKSSKTWILTDGSGEAQFLDQWAGSQHVTSSEYNQEIGELRQAYSATLGATLNNVGATGNSIIYPTLAYYSALNNPSVDYQYSGTETQNLTVQGGTLDIGSSEDQSNIDTEDTTTATETLTVPVYSTVTVPGYTATLPLSLSLSFDSDLGGADGQEYIGSIPYQSLYNAAAQLVGVTVQLPEQTEVVQTGTVTETTTYPVQQIVDNYTQGFTVYNVTGDGGNDVITATAPFVGTVVTGDGNVSVDLGGDQLDFRPYGGFPFPLGAFIQAGAGNDTISGTGGEDTIAGGTGFDYLQGWQGTTYYVPMQGASTDVIGAPVTNWGLAYGGMTPLPLNTLVLPSGVTPQDLQYRTYLDPNSGSQVLQLRYGSSTVLVDYLSYNPYAGFSESSPYFPDENPNNASPGVDLFQFANGSVLTRDELIAQATLLPNDFDPVVSVNPQTLTAGASVSAAGLFTATDSPDDPITWYQVSSSGAGGSYFTLNGTIQPAGQSFYVSQAQLAQLTYVAGSAAATDSVTVSAFDGAIWSSAATLDITPTGSDSDYTATAADQLVSGSASGPDNLTGGLSNDTLAGGSGDDTFVFTPGAGALTISDTIANANTLEFPAGVTPSMISLGIAPDGGLLLRVGTGGDTIDIEGFNAADALGSGAIQNFVFADGTQLSYAQLLARGFDIYGGSGDETLTGTDLSNRIYAGSGNDTLIASGTDDTLVGGAGNDTFVVGTSHDVITQGASASTASNDTVGFAAGVTPTMLSVTVAADGDLVINEGTGGGSVTLEGFNPADPLSSLAVQNFEFADGSSYSLAQLLAQLSSASNGTVANADGTTTSYGSGPSATNASIAYSATTVNASGQTLSQLTIGTDGSTGDSTYQYNADGSYTESTTITPAGGGASSTSVADYNAQGLPVSEQTTTANGITATASWVYATDGSYALALVEPSTGGSGNTTLIDSVNASGQVTSSQTVNADGSSETTEYNAYAQVASTHTVAANGATDLQTWTYNGSIISSETEVCTATPGGPSTTTATDYNAQGQTVSQQTSNADGSSDAASWVYNPDDSYALTLVETPSGGTGSTTVINDVSATGQVTSLEIDNPNASTGAAPESQKWTYNADGSFTVTDAWANADSSEPITQVTAYSATYQVVSQNTYSPSSDGSYTDSWSQADGSHGTYWWNSSTGEYLDTWNNSDGSSFTDEYQYSPGGGPTVAGSSFTETYSASDGDAGTRQYNASTNTTMVTWDSSSTGLITTTSSGDTGFVGLINNEEQTNAQNDPTYFNPAANPAFSNLLAAHG
jgi:Ca2+-binding RTX toxin-like protein